MEVRTFTKPSAIEIEESGRRVRITVRVRPRPSDDDVRLTIDPMDGTAMEGEEPGIYYLKPEGGSDADTIPVTDLNDPDAREQVPPTDWDDEATPGEVSKTLGAPPSRQQQILCCRTWLDRPKPGGKVECPDCHSTIEQPLPTVSEEKFEAMVADATRRALDHISMDEDNVLFTVVSDAVGHRNWTGDVDPLASSALEDGVTAVVRQLVENGVKTVPGGDNLSAEFHKEVLDHLKVDAGVEGGTFEYPGFLRLPMSNGTFVHVGQHGWDYGQLVDAEGQPVLGEDDESVFDIDLSGVDQGDPSAIALAILQATQKVGA